MKKREVREANTYANVTSSGSQRQSACVLLTPARERRGFRELGFREEVLHTPSFEITSPAPTTLRDADDPAHPFYRKPFGTGFVRSPL